MFPPGALITGASSGIGRELAICLARDHGPLVLVARRQEELAATAAEIRNLGGEAHVIPADLSVAAEPPRIAAELAARDIQVDRLVNCAGFGVTGKFADLPIDRQLSMVQVNVTAAVHLTRLLLPGMIERGSGRILNVASTAAFQAGPGMAVYFASKAFLLSFSEALANELRGTGVSVTCLCPGPTSTEFIAKAEMEESLLFGLGTMSSKEVAEIGCQAMRAGKRTVVAGLGNKLAAFSVRLVPRSWAAKVAARLTK